MSEGEEERICVPCLIVEHACEYIKEKTGDSFCEEIAKKVMDGSLDPDKGRRMLMEHYPKEIIKEALQYGFKKTYEYLEKREKK